ncbi:DUF1579 family protein [Streptomyces tsukubensis]|uniref:DUF1579 family protein n=1 Tax=Streptomyces tsukubensis TaxID=83656 RepID=UPI0015C31E30|nr:DUF1579 family protein [Streptomyces tsukubensis]
MSASGVDRPKPSGADTITAPAEMHKLDFLLGSWRCPTTVTAPGGPSETSVVVGTIKPVLGGAWYQWDALRLPNEQMPEKALSRWMIGGWNAASETFTALYTDDRGTHGEESTEPGAAQDGHMKFTGEYSMPTGKFEFIDEFTKISDDHFRDTISAKKGDQFVPAGSVECYRR